MSSDNNNDTAVKVLNLGKKYHLRANQGSLRDAIGHVFSKIIGKGIHRQSDQIIWALRDVNFSLQYGEALGIIGPNGAGKTTILKILSRVTKQTTGKIIVKGRVGALIELGAGLHPELTGRENIYLYSSILGMSNERLNQKFDQIVEFSGIEKFLDTPVKRYSSGMYVRLAFSVAAHTDPNILLVDEVLAVGDAEFRQKCIRQIKTLQSEGVTIILVSHNINQVQSVCQKGIFLLNGRVRLFAPIHEAIRNYGEWLSNSQNSITRIPGHYVELSNKNFKILGIEMFDKEGNAKYKYDYNEPVEIRVNIFSNIRSPSLHFVLKMIRADGFVCGTIRSKESCWDIQDVWGLGHFSINMQNLQLVTETYFIEIRIRDSSDAVTLARMNSPEFRVIGPTSGYGPSTGFFVPNISGVDAHFRKNKQ